jgi:hypothetical protein
MWSFDAGADLPRLDYRAALDQAGATTEVVSLKSGRRYELVQDLALVLSRGCRISASNRICQLSELPASFLVSWCLPVVESIMVACASTLG